jgi:tetratricopeptide (TPR) repeat protein
MTELNAFQEAQLLVLKGDLPASIKAFTRAIAEGVEVFKSHINRGKAHLKIGNLDEALADFETAVSLGEEPGRAFFYRGIAHINKDNCQKAVEDFNEALRIIPERGVVLLARGLALGLLGHKVEAKQDLAKAYAMNDTEIGSFLEEYAISETLCERTMALFEEVPGPWNLVLTNDEVIRMSERESI